MRLRRGVGVLMVAAFIAAIPAVSLAAAFTWDGGSLANSNWSTPENWNPDGAPPTDGTASLIFDGLLRTGAVNNFAAATPFSDLSFATTAGAFTLSGNSISLGGNITDGTASTTQTISLDIALSSVVHTIQVAGSGTLAISGALSGPGAALTKMGPGTLTLSGVNTFTGNTRVIDGSTLQLTGSGKLSSSFVNVQNGILRLGTDTVGATNPLDAGSTVTLGSGPNSGLLDLSGANPTFKSIGTSGTGITNNVTNNSTLSNAILTLQDGVSNFGGTLQDGPTRTTGLTVSGLNVPTFLTLTGNSTYHGPTTVVGTSVNPGTLTVNGAIVSPVTVQSFGGLQGTGSVGNVLMQSSTAAVRPGTSIGTLTMSGLTVDAGSLQFEVGTIDALTDKLSVHNQTNTATTTFNGGLIQALLPDRTYASGSYTLVTSDTNIVYNTPPTLDFPLNTRASPSLDFASDPKKVLLNIANSPATALLWTGANGTPTTAQWRLATGAAPFAWNNGPSGPASDPDASHHFYNYDSVLFDNTSLVKQVDLVDDVIANRITVDNGMGANNYEFMSSNSSQLSASILKKGGGDLKLSLQTFIGATIEAGRIILNVANSLPYGFVLGGGSTGGKLELNGFDASVYDISMAGSAGAAANMITNNAALTTSHLNWVGTSSSFSGTLADGSGQLALTVNSQLSFGVLSLNASNTFTGGVTVISGALALGSPGALNAVAPNTLTFNPTTSAELRLNGNSVTVSSLNSTGPGTSNIKNGDFASVAATLTVDNVTSDTFSGTIQNGLLGSAVSLVKNGPGKLTLGGADSYSGATTISGGTLLVNGTHTGAGNYVVGPSGTLGGIGSITFAGGASLTVNGTLAPGASIESLDVVGNVLFSNASVLQIELNGASGLVDLFNITGNISIANGAIAQFLVTGVPTASEYVFGTYTGALTGGFGSSSVPTGYSLMQGGGTLRLVQVPEPGTFVLAMLGFVSALSMLRRRRQPTHQ